MFTLKIKVKSQTNTSLQDSISYKKGDWIDLRISEDVVVKAPIMGLLKKRRKDDTTDNTREVRFDSGILPLGIAMQLPEGYEAIVAPRSSAYKNFGIIMSNSIGIIDNSYKGDNDLWGFPYIAMKNCTLQKGTRVCQFRIRLSQKASVWQKIKWLFTSNIRFEYVESFGSEDRNGFGSTGIN